MPKNLDLLFSPKSIAVVGASRSPEKVGAVVYKNIKNSPYTGKVFPVNKNAESIDGSVCYKSIAEIKEKPDLVIVCIPANLVIGILEEAGNLGIKNVVVISAGFKEIGEEGVKLENNLIEVCKKFEINLLGPNCLGFVNNNIDLNATFAKSPNKKGNLRFISQSGALATSIFDWFSAEELGFSQFVTLGNKAVLNENDILEYFSEQDHAPVATLEDEFAGKTKPVGMYLESISKGQEFIKLTKEISKNNPIFIIKPGKTVEAAQAMQSHTGAIAGADDILETALMQGGVLRCSTLEEFFDLSKAFSWNCLPEGPRTAVISNAGGPAVISSDFVVSEGLELAKFDQETKDKLAKILPRTASIIDPVDVLGDALAQRYQDALEIVRNSKMCDAMLIILTPQMMTQIKKTAEIIGSSVKKTKTPVFCAFIGGTAVSEGQKELNKLNVPSFRFPEQAIKAISSMWKFKKQQDKLLKETTDISVLNSQILPKESLEIIQNAVKNNQKALDNLEADKVVSSSGIQTPKTIIAENLSEAVEFSKSSGYPVVLKMSSPGLLHKKHVGGVVLDISNEEKLDDAWNLLEKKKSILDQDIRDSVKFQVQKEIPAGVEILIGLKRDNIFGSVVLFGAGGTYAELIADKNIRLLPVDMNAVSELVKESKIYKILQGEGSEPTYALEKLYKLIFTFSKIFESSAEIHEMEINPVIVTANDVWAVDTKIILEQGSIKSTGPKFKSAVCKKVEQLTTKVRYLEFETDDFFDIKPGQYVSVRVSSTRLNCYSVAGKPSDNKFNLLVDTTPGGPGSRFFENIKAEDKMSFLGPMGNFTLRDDADSKNIIFLATGTGLAPLKSMIEQLLFKENTKKNIFLYLGVNNYEDIFMKDYLEGLQSKYSNFKYKIALANKSEKWDGPVGFITAILNEDFPKAKDCSAYMCGNKFMIRDASKILIDNGCRDDKIYFEKYS